MVQDGLDEDVRIGSGHGCFVREPYAVAQDFFRDSLHVFGDGVIAAGNCREGLRGADESDGCARGRSVRDHAGVFRHSERSRITGSGNHVGYVGVELVVDVHSVFHGLAEREDFFFSENFRNRRNRGRRHPSHDFDFFRLARIIYLHLQEESIERRFRERIRTLFFERVHGGDHEERGREREGFSRDGNSAFLHGFKQGGLDFGRGAVDFVGNDDVRENRSLLNGKFPRLRTVGFGSYDIRRKEVGSELYANRVEIERLGQRFRDERLREARNSFEQNVAIGKKTYEKTSQKVFLTDDDVGNFATEGIVRFFYRDY